MKRKIEYKVTGGGRVSPSTRQWGGMQYEDNATELVFDISDTEVKKEGILWRIDFNSSAAGYNPSETLTVEGGRVKRLLPYDMTRCGGEVQVTLVGTEVDLEGKEQSIAYSVPVTVYLTEVEQDEETAKEIAPRLSAMEASAVAAAERADNSSIAAEKSAEEAKRSEEAAADSAEEAKRSEEAAADSAEEVKAAIDKTRLKLIKKITLEEDVTDISVTFDKGLDEIALYMKLAFDADTTKNFCVRSDAGNWYICFQSMPLSTTAKWFFAHTKEIAERRWKSHILKQPVLTLQGAHESINDTRLSISERGLHISRLVKNLNIFLNPNTTVYFKAGSVIEIWGREAE